MPISDDDFRSLFFPASTANLPPTTYHGNCHCGHVKFTASLPDIRKGIIARCNCSICTKNGYLFVYPKHEDVRFTSGLEDMVAYRFAGQGKQHRFCPKCGTSVLIDFSGAETSVERMVTAVNIRTFVEIEEMMDELTFVDIDGKNLLGPAYTVPQ